MLQDLRHTWQALLRAPGFALLSLLTLSCGLGFAIYTAGVYFSFTAGDLPFPQPERLVAVEATRHGDRTQAESVHYLDYLAQAQGVNAFEGLLALKTATVTLGGPTQYPVNVKAAYVPSGIWAWLGAAAQPVAGRQLQAQDELPGAPPVAVIGAQVVRSQWGSDKPVVGQHVKVNGIDTEIVGVVPADLRFPVTQQLWLPFKPPAGPLARVKGSMGSAQHVMVLGRLKPGSSRDEAQQGLDLRAQQLATSYPASNADVGAIALPYHRWGMPDTDLITMALSVAAGLLLMLVCINTGNLLLARANERRQELAIRAALGAPRGRLIQQMLGETWLLCVAAALIGLFFSAWALDATQQAVLETADDRLPFWIHFRLTWPAVAAGAAASLGTALLTGAWPAWRASAVDLASVLRDGRGANGRAAGRFSQGLVLVQIALSSLLLLVAGSQSLEVHHRLTAGTGARTEGVLTAVLTPRLPAYRKALDGPPASGADSPATLALRELWASLEANLQEAASSANARVALSSSLPGGGMELGDEVLPEGMTVSDDHYPFAGTYSVNAGFFQALDVQLLAGREFTPQDRADTLHVAVVNRNFANAHWPGQNPLGKRFALRPSAKSTQKDWFTVVGVTPHLLQGIGNADGMRSANVYLPLSQVPPDQINIGWVGVPDNPASRDALARAVAKTNPALALEKVSSALERQRIAHGGEEVMAALCLVLGLLTLALAVSGIYGVTSRAVQLRTQEIGVRRAVGANDAQLLRWLLGRGVRLLLIALPLGLIGGAVLLAGDASSLALLGSCVVTVGLLMGSLVLLSIWWPARQALRVLPSTALNQA